MTASRAPARPAVAGIDRAAFETFLIQEARLLDERRFREWMELFAEDGTYWVPAVPDQASPFDQVSLFYDDRELMKTRVERLEHPRIHVQTPPSRTAHLVGNVLLEQADEAKGEYVVGSTMITVEPTTYSPLASSACSRSTLPTRCAMREGGVCTWMRGCSKRSTRVFISARSS